MINLISNLEEQEAMRFTGKLNLLDSNSAQIKGVILFNEGYIVNCFFSYLTGVEALKAIGFLSFRNPKQFSCVAEPEIIKEQSIEFQLTTSELNEEYQQFFKEMNSVYKYKPPENIKFLINSESLVKEPEINWCEFRALCTISENSNLSTYLNSVDLIEYEAIKSLVSLRVKKIIKVYKEK